MLGCTDLGIVESLSCGNAARGVSGMVSDCTWRTDRAAKRGMSTVASTQAHHAHVQSWLSAQTRPVNQACSLSGLIVLQSGHASPTALGTDQSAEAITYDASTAAERHYRNSLVLSVECRANGDMCRLGGPHSKSQQSATFERPAPFEMPAPLLCSEACRRHFKFWGLNTLNNLSTKMQAHYGLWRIRGTKHVFNMSTIQKAIPV